MQYVAAQLVVLLQCRDGFCSVDRCLSLAATLRVLPLCLLQRIAGPSAGFLLHTRLTFPIACIRPCPCIGLSTYMVWPQGASNPVSHMSRTITQPERTSRGLEMVRHVLATLFATNVLLPFRSISGGTRRHNLHEPLFIVFAVPVRPKGNNFVVPMQMRRDMQTIMPLPSIASVRFSKCSTRSFVTTFRRPLSPTTASSAAHFVFSFF